MSALPDIGLFIAERLAVGDENLLLDQIDTYDLFRDGVLDLKPGVHLEEEVIFIFVDKEFDGPCSDIPYGRGCSDGIAPHPFAQFGRDEWRWTLLDDFLVAPLYGALPITKVNDVAVHISQNLEFDVVGLLDETLYIYRVVAE